MLYEISISDYLVNLKKTSCLSEKNRMTSITFGGGPTVEARRDFSNLKEGSQVPGYFEKNEICFFGIFF